MSSHKLAIVTGASSGIGLELAKLAARDGYDLLIAADTPLDGGTRFLRDLGAEVRAVETDLATFEGVDKLLAAAEGRPVRQYRKTGGAADLIGARQLRRIKIFADDPA